VFSAGVSKLGFETGSAPFFDTVKVTVGEGQAEKIAKDATAHGVNLRVFDSKSVSDGAAELVSRLGCCDQIVFASHAGGAVLLPGVPS
jgi:glycine dehydrogenase